MVIKRITLPSAHTPTPSPAPPNATATQIFGPVFAGHASQPGAMTLANAPILIDQDDDDGVYIAAQNLADDFGKVTGLSPARIIKSTGNLDQAAGGTAQATAILVGSISKSRAIQALVEQGKLDISAIEGQWETYTTNLVTNPWEGCERALVIAGSDKRGAIYGIYSLSEQIGVSPWYWWTDVPPRQSTELYAYDVAVRDGPPSVKYRGIFLNDEAPALDSWAQDKFGPKFNVEFYKHVFELLLRLKANFLWPAMWRGFPYPGRSFFVDDPLNQTTADQYGIVVSTSHHEPMQRAMNEWFNEPYNQPEGSWSWIKNKEKITEYFRGGAQRAKPFESYLTMGMRGDGDSAINVPDPKAIVAEVLQTQRNIIKETYGSEDGVTQLMALYKEVQGYYDAGLQIPDDITLLFSDDNYGSIRRLPTGDESRRKGRAGVYYHLEYVGSPRSYKWLNSNSCGKVWQQLDLAYRRGADQIWICNVGDLKPMEVPLTFAMRLGWNTKMLPDMSQLPAYFEAFAEMNFGKGVASSCASLLFRYDRQLAFRRHEHIEPSTFSLLNYNEADAILGEWSSMLAEAEELYTTLDSVTKPAFFELVLHPIKASYLYVALRVTQGKNKMYAEQRRTSTNRLFQAAVDLFDQDYTLTEEYHSLLNGKWNHILRQPHYGYTDLWLAPSRDMISGLSLVQKRADSNPIVGFIGVCVEGHAGERPGLINEDSDRTHPSRGDLIRGLTLPPMDPYGPKQRWLELYSRSNRVLTWTLEPVAAPWITLSETSGTTDPDHDTRIFVSIAWDSVPPNFTGESIIKLTTSLGDYEEIHLPLTNRSVPAGTPTAYIQSEKYISILAKNYVSSPGNEADYMTIPHIGRAGAVRPSSLTSPSHPTSTLAYPIYTFTPYQAATILLTFTFTLDTEPNLPLTYTIYLDDNTSPIVPETRLIPKPAVAGDLPPGWDQSVMNNVWVKMHQVDLSRTGLHVVRVGLAGGGNCLLEKVVVRVGEGRGSYLGPGESVRVG